MSLSSTNRSKQTVAKKMQVFEPGFFGKARTHSATLQPCNPRTGVEIAKPVLSGCVIPC